MGSAPTSRWDPAVFSFSNIDATGGVFDPSASTGICAQNTTTDDSDGAGVEFGCAGFSSTTVGYHLLANVLLTPAASGCSALHVYTYGGADGGNDSTGSYTINAADTTPQTNTYRDGTSAVTGHTCTPPHQPAGLPARGAAPNGQGNCTYDFDYNGRINIIDIAEAAGHYNTVPGSPGWNPRFDINADGRINILDLSLMAGNYELPVTGCSPEYPYYPLGTWDGTLPNGYQWTQYVINLHAMAYRVGQPHPWVFVTDNGDLTEYSAEQALKSLANAIHNSGTLLAQVYVGPNDCTDLFTGAGQSIATAAGVLVNMINAANTWSVNNALGVEFYATVDDEAYRVLNGFCGDSNRAYQFPNTLALFTDYQYEAAAVGALVKTIGPAGAPQMSSSDEASLATAGGGQAIPQVYSYLNAQALRPGGGGCTIDGYGPHDGSWPYAIANGYAGIQSDADYGSNYSSWQGNIRWTMCHDASPPSNFNWLVPGRRG